MEHNSKQCEMIVNRRPTFAPLQRRKTDGCSWDTSVSLYRPLSRFLSSSTHVWRAIPLYHGITTREWFLLLFLCVWQSERRKKNSNIAYCTPRYQHRLSRHGETVFRRRGGIRLRGPPNIHLHPTVPYPASATVEKSYIRNSRGYLTSLCIYFIGWSGLGKAALPFSFWKSHDSGNNEHHNSYPGRAHCLPCVLFDSLKKRRKVEGRTREFFLAMVWHQYNWTCDFPWVKRLRLLIPNRQSCVHSLTRPPLTSLS